MIRFSRAVRLAILLGGVWTEGPTVARAAAPAPYSDWIFDLKRAGESHERWAELSRKTPAFARTWFYGNVLDLVTVGVTDDVRASLRPRLEAIAETLRSLDPPDNGPALLLDRVGAGTLTELGKKARDVEDDLLAAGRSGDPIVANVAAATHPDLARIVFYRLLARAETTRSRMGGDREAAVILDMARRIAEGYALAVDDLSPWSAMAQWEGTPGVTVDKALVIDNMVGGALNLALAGDAPAARAKLQTALETAQASHGATFRTALILNGTASLAARAGDALAAQRIRHQVLLQIRPLNEAALVALIADQLVKTYLVAKDYPEAALYTRELRSLGPVVYQTADYLIDMDHAAAALLVAGQADIAAGRFGAGMSLYEESGRLYDLLKAREQVATMVPLDRVETVRIERERAYGDVRRAQAAAAVRRGRPADARTHFEAARSTYEGVGAIDGLGDVETELAGVDLSEGNLDGALKWVNQAIDRLASGAAAPLARALGQRGWIRLRRGEAAAAFENANAGLTTLKAQGDPARFVVERAGLHRLAATALDAAGFHQAARERVQFALQIHASAETVLLAAQLAFEDGDLAGVEAAFKGVPDAVVDPRVRQVYRGCTQARTGDAEAAATTLAQVSTLVAPALRPYQIAGRTCLAAADLVRGRVQDAANAIVPAQPLATEYGDPALLWRVSALVGDVSNGLGRVPEAASAWQQAVDRYGDALLERSERGYTLDLRLPGLPVTPERALAAVPAALAQAADGAKPDEAQTARLASLSYAQFASALDASPAQTGGALLDLRPASELAVRSALTALASRHLPLRDAAVEGADRATVLTALAADLKRLREALSSARTEAPAYFSWLLPTPQPGAGLAPAPGEARIFYQTGDAAGRVWLWLPGDPAPQSYALPGRAALAELLTPAVAAMLHPPQAFPAKFKGRTDPNAKDLDALAKPVGTLLPFLANKKLAARLNGLTLHLYPDGPLLRFPMEALVVAPAPPRSPGAPPVFLGARHKVVRSLLPGMPATARPGDGSKDAERPWATFGPAQIAEGCPPVMLQAVKGLYDPCAGADALAEVEKVKAAFASTPEKLSTASGSDATAPAYGRALETGRTVHLAAPLDVDSGDVLTSPNPDGAPGRAPPFGVARTASRAERVVATRLSAPPLANETGAGLRRFAAALRFVGVDELTILAWRNGADTDGDLLATAAASVSGGTPFPAALANETGGARDSRVDPNVGGVPAWHPWFWARWLTYTP